MAVAHPRVSMAAALPAVVLWVLFFNNGALQVSSFNLGSIPGFGGNSIPGLSNVGNMLGIGQCDLHIGNIFKCNEEIKNFHGANPPQSSPPSTSTASSSSPQQSPGATDQSPTPTPCSSFNDSLSGSPDESPAVSSADSPAESPDDLPRSPPPMILHVSPTPTPDGEEAADLTMEEGTSVDSAISLFADKASAPSDSNQCCRAVLHVHLNCLCSFLSLKMVMALQLAEGYLVKVASMCHIDFKGC